MLSPSHLLGIQSSRDTSELISQIFFAYLAAYLQKLRLFENLCWTKLIQSNKLTLRPTSVYMLRVKNVIWNYQNFNSALNNGLPDIGNQLIVWKFICKSQNFMIFDSPETQCDQGLKKSFEIIPTSIVHWIEWRIVVSATIIPHQEAKLVLFQRQQKFFRGNRVIRNKNRE